MPRKAKPTLKSAKVATSVKPVAPDGNFVSLYKVLDERFKEHETRSTTAINEVKELLKEQDQRSAERHEKTQEKLAAHGERLANLETTVKEGGNWKNWVLGVVAVILGGAVIAFFKK